MSKSEDRPLLHACESAGQLARISDIHITSDQLDRAFQVHGAFEDDAIETLAVFAEAEGIVPARLGAKALAVRLTLFRALVDQWIEPEDCCAYLRAASASRLLQKDAGKNSDVDNLCFDPDQFEALLLASRNDLTVRDARPSAAP